MKLNEDFDDYDLDDSDGSDESYPPLNFATFSWLDLISSPISRQNEIGFWLKRRTPEQIQLLNMEFRLLAPQHQTRVTTILHDIVQRINKCKKSPNPVHPIRPILKDDMDELDKAIVQSEKGIKVMEKTLDVLDSYSEILRRSSREHMQDAIFFFGLAAFMLICLIVYFVNR